MKWSDVTTPPPARVLRQFSLLCLAFGVLVAARRIWHGHLDLWTWGYAGVGAAVALAGTLRPSTVRWVYTGAMILAFPIGWTVTRVILAAVYYLMFTPLAMIFRLMGRDELRLKRPSAPPDSYWQRRRPPPAAADYFRQF